MEHKIFDISSIREIEGSMPFEDRPIARTVYELVARTAERYGNNPAVSFQLTSDKDAEVFCLTWQDYFHEVTRLANALRDLGIGTDDVVSYVLPNCLEATIALMAGATAGIVGPINPLLSPEHIASILRETGCKVVITLAPFPKSRVAQDVARAVADVPSVQHVLEIDLLRYAKSWQKPLIQMTRPRFRKRHHAKVTDYHTTISAYTSGHLTFEDCKQDRVCSVFHTGGTTGFPKVAQHQMSGVLYNSWCGSAHLFEPEDVAICCLPMFHVFAAYPVFAACVMSGSHFVMPTPQGFRGAGVIENFWKLVERHRATVLPMVPTAAAALLQHKLDADISSLRLAFSGSAPMPMELFRRFESMVGLKIIEGYGMTEATCLIAINPIFGAPKIGSVGLSIPYSNVKLLKFDDQGNVTQSCEPGRVGEICVRNPAVGERIYVTDENNKFALTPDKYLRTGDLGWIDEEGYLWITGRVKDIILRSGHNIDPLIIEDAFMGHEDVVFAAAIGQPDKYAGEVPAVYLELRVGATIGCDKLLEFASTAIPDRAAMPKYVEILDDLPKTIVGKVYKPDLRKRAISRVYNEALANAGLEARVVEVVDDIKHGLTAILMHGNGDCEDAKARKILSEYTRPWHWLVGDDPDD